MALSTTALTTIGRACEFGNIDSTSPILITLINAASNRIEDWLARKIRSQNYSEIYDYPRAGIITLNQPDVTALSFLAFGNDPAMTVTYTGTDTHARVEVTDTSLIQTSRAGTTTTTTTTTFAAQATTTALATAAAAVSGWAATVINIVPSGYLVRQGAMTAKNASVSLPAWSDFTGTYSVNYIAGLIDFQIRNFWPQGIAMTERFGDVPTQCRVDYTAGFSTIPGNVELVCLQMVTQAYQQIGRDLSIQSEREGDYAIAYRDMPSIESNLQWVEWLTQYRRILA